MKENKNKVCPVESAGALDNPLRRFLQNPEKILKPYLKENDKALDLGCGPGFFSIEMAKIVGEKGKVISADLQDGMLEKVKKKIFGTNLEQRIILYKCKSNKIGLKEKVDFILAFFMIHEVPDQDKMFNELKEILTKAGKLLIVEPNFHVSKKAFSEMIIKLEKLGFKVIEKPKMLFCRSVLLIL
ncbi:MAG: class I SAM-dependent methyltransferase [Ignavibacteria bacterium]|nr:class I SAM-dependent methyltransferase [Ignavibacteria bacterium]